MNIDDFFTVPACNKAQRLPLYDVEGKDSGQWIDVLGVDSDSYQKASEGFDQRLLEIDYLVSMAKAKAMESDDLDYASSQLAELSKKRTALITERRYALLAALIAGWSMDTDCNEKEKQRLLRNAPMIREEIDRFAGNRHNFLKKK